MNMCNPRRFEWRGVSDRCLMAILLFVFMGPPALAALPDTTRERLTQLLGSLPKKTTAGLVVKDPRSGDILYDHNGRTPLKPASVMKLMITAAALDWFQPDMVYRTSFYLSEDELWIVGGGDPGLGDDRLAAHRGTSPMAFVDRLAEELKKRQITSINKVVIDDTRFDKVGRHSDWDVNQWDRWYAAPVGALMLMNNCVDFRVRVSNGKVAITTDPKLPASFLENNLKVSKKHAPRVKRKPESDVFQVEGTIQRSGGLGHVSVGRPAPFVGHAIATALRERGIEVSNDVVRRPLATGVLAEADPLYEHETSIALAVWRCNNFSQNLYAEALLKSLAALNSDGSPSGDRGSWPDGIARLRHILSAMGVDHRMATFRDGSGLSHGNRLTARMIAELLIVMDNHPQRDVFRRSLAQPRKSGTLRSQRYAGLEGKLWGKTGTIRGVRTLAGYARRPEGYDVTFALLVNGAMPNNFRAQVVKALTR